MSTRIFQAAAAAKGHLALDSKFNESIDANVKNLLWEHHCCFQDAANYYLFALACLGSRSESGQLNELYKQLSTLWEDFHRDGQKRLGLKRTIPKLLGLSEKNSDIDSCRDQILEGNDSPDELLALAGESIMADLGKDSAIQQKGREYLPRLCLTDFSGNFPRSKRLLEKKAAEQSLPITLWSSDKQNVQELAANLHFHLFANLAAGPSLDPTKKQKLFHDAIEFFETSKSITPSQKGQLIDTYQKIKDTIEIPAYAGGSVNKDSLKQRFFAFLIFKYLETSEASFQLLRDSYPKPKENPSKPKENPNETRFIKFGNDPVLLSRQKRGYLFPAFTSLRS